jgi:predicted AAA+ superfamily ATPase
MIRGGFPANLSLNEKQSFIFYNNYVKNLIEEDVQKIDGVKKNIPKMNALVKSLSRNSATNILNTTLLNDVSQYDTEISKNTLPQYLESLERCNFFYRIKAFSPFNAHSKTTIRTTDKIILCDECLGLALLNLNKDNILKQLNNFGHHFESFVLKELLAYASCINAEIFFYKDNTYEVDAIMVLEDKSYIAFEIKLGSDEEESAIQSLKKFDKFMEGKNNKPLKLVALIGVGSVSRKVEDNLYVVSLEHFTL